MTLNLYLLLLLVLFRKIYCENAPYVVIIGAGPAGVAAATRLLENNITNIKIIEAENRIGGRIHSVHFGNATVDLGAEWCHGETDNIVFSMVKDLDIFDTASEIYSIEFLKSDGQEINGDFAEELLNLYVKIYELNTSNQSKEGLSVGQFFISEYNATISNLYETNETKLNLARQMSETFDRFLTSHEGAFTSDQPSAISDYKTCDGNSAISWNGRGYKTILDILIKSFPDKSKELPFYEKLILNKTVSKILWQRNEGDGVKIQFTDGSQIDTELVIFTPSLGVLKHDHGTLFEPSLPKNKIEVIEDLGISAVFKLILHFPVKWWEGDDAKWCFVWDEESKKSVSEDFPGPKQNGVSWITNIFSFMQPGENPNVLTGWIVGPEIPEIEKLCEQLMLDASFVVLSKFLGHKYNVTKPDKAIWSDWYTNPHFRGSYSYQTKKSRRRPNSPELELAEPLLDGNKKPAVLFAGEATHPYYYSTVHGAIETGFREADRVIQMYNNK